MKGKKFLLLVDKSTDMSCEKVLALCVRYHNSAENNMMNEYLGSIVVVGTTGEELFHAVSKIMEENCLEFLNVIGR